MYEICPCCGLPKKPKDYDESPIKHDGGILVLVVKNFVRNGKQVRLDEDTIRLCQIAGFKLIARHYRKLTSQSFWRILYARKWKKEHPDEECPVPQWEDILVFRKESGNNGLCF